MFAIGRAVAALTLLLAAGVQPVGAQEVAPQACADIKEQIRYLTNEGTFIQDAGQKNGVDLLANAIMVHNAACGTGGDESIPPPEPADSPPTPGPAPTPRPTPDVTIPPMESDTTRRDACLLVTEDEVGRAMRQGVVANESDIAGGAGGQGCEFNGAGAAYTDIMYFQAAGPFVYDAFRATAEPNGVQTVPGLGDRAFTYVGGNGPGVVVLKGDKLFTIEFSGFGNGQAESSSLLVLAQQALGRVR
ncbi:MAG: hypothetical protein ACR2IK_07105 [Chloroflexota bacterium]